MARREKFVADFQELKFEMRGDERGRGRGPKNLY